MILSSWDLVCPILPPQSSKPQISCWGTAPVQVVNVALQRAAWIMKWQSWKHCASAWIVIVFLLFDRYSIAKGPCPWLSEILTILERCCLLNNFHSGNSTKRLPGANCTFLVAGWYLVAGDGLRYSTCTYILQLPKYYQVLWKLCAKCKRFHNCVCKVSCGTNCTQQPPIARKLPSQ